MNKRQAAEEEEAEDYAWIIRNRVNVDWSARNADIIDRFSLTALSRIKRRAWQILQSGEQHGS